ncbi:hypothetical protein M3J09_006335 [Ascochyta lentis]
MPRNAQIACSTKTTGADAIDGIHQNINSSGSSWLRASQETDNRSQQHLGHSRVGSYPL